MGNGNGGRKGVPGSGRFGISEADKAMMTLIQARQKGCKSHFISCKCGNRVLLRHELVEAVVNEYPKMLGLPKDKFPEKEIRYRVLSEVFICPKCKIEVVSRKINSLTRIEPDDKGKNRIENVEEHPSGGKKK